jgi:hypothetical protein
MLFNFSNIQICSMLQWLLHGKIGVNEFRSVQLETGFSHKEVSSILRSTFLFASLKVNNMV